MLTYDTASDEIIYLIKRHSHENYDGRPICILSHMILCAMLAIKENADDELILSAFLHDIGYLVKHCENRRIFNMEDHGTTGARYLIERGVSDRISSIVGMNVQAERYLAAKEVSYVDHLSTTSWHTLQWQGGAMTETEADAFSRHPFFDDIIRIRIWHEKAMNITTKPMPLNFFRDMIRKHLNDVRNK